MKIRPWYHWLTSDLDLTACLTKEQKTRYGKVKFLSKDKEDVFTGFDGPNVEPVGGQALETLVKPVIKKWMMNRLDKDFFSKPEELVKSPTNVRRWMAHLLLTTSINISTSETSRGDPDILTMMTGRGRNHFLNDELLTTDYGTSLNLLVCSISRIPLERKVKSLTPRSQILASSPLTSVQLRMRKSERTLT